MKSFRTSSLALMLLSLALTTRAESFPPVIPSFAPSALVWDAVEKKADLEAMTNLTHFTFWVTNISAGEATIFSTETSCDCTVAEAAKKLPWHLAPDESGVLNVNVNTLGKFGLVTKTVTVHTTDGTQVLTIQVKIPVTPAPFNVSARKQDMMAAQADRQAVFRGSCAACHTWPTVGQTGEPLFQKACAICHVSDHRAEMVPDLARLTRATNAEYWRTNITSGKAGSLMPAFGKSEGGILDTNQIESLVDYLVKKYPSATASAVRGALSE